MKFELKEIRNSSTDSRIYPIWLDILLNDGCQKSQRIESMFIFYINSE